MKSNNMEEKILFGTGASIGASSITTLAPGSIIIKGILEQHFGVAYL